MHDLAHQPGPGPDLHKLAHLRQALWQERWRRSLTHEPGLSTALVLRRPHERKGPLHIDYLGRASGYRAGVSATLYCAKVLYLDHVHRAHRNSMSHCYRRSRVIW